jgi:FkbM family methyltransferase
MKEGEVYAFEPHPTIFSILSRNRSRWKEEVSSVHVEARQVALSDRMGTTEMYVPPWWNENAGIASLEEKSGSKPVKVSTECLDDAVKDPIHLLKLDVEGHENSVLRGGNGPLEKENNHTHHLRMPSGA